MRSTRYVTTRLAAVMALVAGLGGGANEGAGRQAQSGGPARTLDVTVREGRLYVQPQTD